MKKYVQSKHNSRDYKTQMYLFYWFLICVSLCWLVIPWHFSLAARPFCWKFFIHVFCPCLILMLRSFFIVNLNPRKRWTPTGGSGGIGTSPSLVPSNWDLRFDIDVENIVQGKAGQHLWEILFGTNEVSGKAETSPSKGQVEWGSVADKMIMIMMVMLVMLVLLMLMVKHPRRP